MALSSSTCTSLPESTNPYLTHPSPLALLQSTAANPLSSLSNRALILEAAIQAPSLPKDGLEEAALWRQLGMVQTQDEKELAGMRALEEAVRMYGRAEERGEFNEGMGRERERREMGEGLMVRLLLLLLFLFTYLDGSGQACC
jgi:hypothetical protein